MTVMMEEAELLPTDALGRVKMPAGKRELILDKFEASGLSAAQFAEHLGVKYPTFATWVQKRKKARGQYPEKTEVSAKLSLVEAVVESRASAPAVKVKLAGGIELEVNELGQVALAVELVNALRAGGC